MAKVTGIGGVFFKSKDPNQLREWYNQNLGFEAKSWGAMFEWRNKDNTELEGVTVWNAFPETSTKFDPSTKEFMMNYIVEDLEGLIAQLKEAGVTVLDEIAASEYGKFVHILDPEGNAIELWEPPVEG